MSEFIQDNEEFRDSISTVDREGKRVWIYPKKPRGKFYNLRTYVSWVLLLILFGLPFIKINGDPFLLFNVIERKFILFGIIFTPQDLHLFALAMISLFVFVVLFTVIFGRLFCGWVCPQTIFMEMVFRKIEYWIEGDYTAQSRLTKAPWTFDKIWKRVLKHSIFFSISVLIANTFLAYIIGMDEVIMIVSEPISRHFGGFIAMLVFSGIFYFVFAWFREQVCIAVCPYGRLQGVLLTKESIVVAYDHIRGEPRGKIKKQKPGKTLEPLVPLPTLGDCIDCKLCIKVCPTGIDIRNGTQLECINCTACMDACDEVMEKVDREKGLIRLDSLVGVEEKKTKIFSTRAVAYSFILGALVLLQVFLFANRSEVEAVILRTPGMLYLEVEEGYITNLYNYHVINKTSKDIKNISFKIRDDIGKIRVVGNVNDITKQEMGKGSFFIDIKRENLEDQKNRIVIEVYSDGELIEDANTTFLGPDKK